MREQHVGLAGVGLIFDHAPEQIGGLLVLIALDVKPREREVEPGIAIGAVGAMGLLEMLDGFAEVLSGIRGRLARLVWLRQRRVDAAEHAMRVDIGRVDLQRGFRSAGGVLDAPLPRVEAGQLGRNRRRRRVERGGALIRRDRLVDLAVALEVPAEQELVIRLGGRSRG